MSGARACPRIGSPSAGHWAPFWEKSRQVCGELETSPSAESLEQRLVWGPGPWGSTVGWGKGTQGWWCHRTLTPIDITIDLIHVTFRKTSEMSFNIIRCNSRDSNPYGSLCT